MNENTLKPKISFGIIVLNGEPFTKYCLRSLYNFAHEIIIVEGATENAKDISTPDGHSVDSTLQSISDFIRDEDKDKKVKLITKNGFWEEKDEMSQAYATQATGNYLWQVDIDEFYTEDDMHKAISLLEKDPAITAISFRPVTFWGGINYIENGPIFGDFHRLFKFGKGYEYTMHRPPTVVNNDGKNLRKIKWIDGTAMKDRYNIRMYHYSILFPLQVDEKTKYYISIFKKDFQKWADNNYYKLGDPFHVNNTYWSISWLERYSGKHPAQILKLMSDIEKNGDIKLRNNADVEKLLDSTSYKISTVFLDIFFESYFRLRRLAKKILVAVNVLKRE